MYRNGFILIAKHLKHEEQKINVSFKAQLRDS